MNSIYVLIPLAILLVSIAAGVFFWAVKSNQFEDLERHGSSILFDDDLPKKAQKSQSHTPPLSNKSDE
ncbi:MAG: cbb3-type cytochrome oxidase maturation protein [Paraglaciecola sp.]